MLLHIPCFLKGEKHDGFALFHSKVDPSDINYLVNVGPDHLGRIPGPGIEILKKRPKWTNKSFTKTDKLKFTDDLTDVNRSVIILGNKL